jgi:hypothetical protein
MGDHKAISIFAGESSYRKTRSVPYPHIVRGSSLIRGKQIAERLGCKFNPESGYENDVCVYVKPNSMDAVKDDSWVDVVDGYKIVQLLLKERPGVNAIAVSEFVCGIYRSWVPNKMVVIEPHHCNFNRERRTRQEVTTVGYIGSEAAFRYRIEDMRKLVEGLGMGFKWNSTYSSRQDVIDFYKQIDIQVVWAGDRFKWGQQSIGPTKAINAASFGVPTIAYPQVCYQEIEGNYIKAETFEEVAKELVKLKDLCYYESWAAKVDWTEKYHIDKRAELYQQLEFV